MQIIGFNFEKILAEKKNITKGAKIQINSNINIKSIEQEKIDIVKDQSALRFNFEFKVDYKPDIAEILLQGFVLVLVPKDESKNILKKWKKNEVPNDIRIPLFNTIMTKSNLKALQLEEELNLPTHIPLPKIRPEQPNQNYTG